MFLEICMHIYSVVFALSRHINKQNVCENNSSPCKGNKVFVKYQAQGTGFNPKVPPLRTPLVPIRKACISTEHSGPCKSCRPTVHQSFQVRSIQCCQLGGFLAQMGCFFRCVAGNFLLLRVAVVWASFIKVCAVFWAIFGK